MVKKVRSSPTKIFEFCLITLLIFIGCSEDHPVSTSVNCAEENYFSEFSSRNFKMGFTTWSYGPKIQNVDDTYQFIKNQADIYAEHIDNKIPWNAWRHDLDLPIEFSIEIAGRVSRRITNKEFLLSVSLLNSNRSDLAEDFDGKVPNYVNLNDSAIENAYFKHIQYLIDAFNPDYLVIAIEVNELKLRSPNKWEGYKLLIQNVKSRIKQIYPNLKISESISLHNLYDPDIANSSDYINEMVSHMNNMEFVSISFYPFFNLLDTKEEFQEVFDFLNNHIDKPIAFVETAHLAENLSVPNFDLSIAGTHCEQNAYLETLLRNSQIHNYLFVIWWAHRDYDALWQVFPDELKDIGKLWKDTGLLDEDGNQRSSFSTWEKVFNK